jgi:transposase
MASDIHSGFVGRLEVVQTGRRRRWTPEQKAAIIQESLSGRESVSAVARRHDIAPGQLFGWRRNARLPEEEVGFAPAMVLEGATGLAPGGRDAPVMVIELPSGGRVLIGDRASAAQVRAVLRSLR